MLYHEEIPMTRPCHPDAERNEILSAINSRLRDIGILLGKLRVDPHFGDVEALPRTQFELVRSVLERRRDWMHVGEIAAITGIPPAAVRAHLYSNRELFERDEISPRRIRWRIARQPARPAVAQDVQENPDPYEPG